MSAVRFLVYDSAGRILRYGSCPSDLVSGQAQAGETAMAFANPVEDTTHYHNGTTVVTRPTNPASLSGMTISNVPSGSTIEIEGVRYPVEGSTVNLSFTYPGTYEVKLLSFPAVDTLFEVTYEP